MAAADTREADFFGEGTVNPTGYAPIKVADRNDAPNPNNPTGLSNNDLWLNHENNQSLARATGNSNAGAGGGLGTNPADRPGFAPILTTGEIPGSGFTDSHGRDYSVTRSTPQQLTDRIMREFQVSDLGVNDNRPDGATAGGAVAGGAAGYKVAGPWGGMVGAVDGALLGASEEFAALPHELGGTALTDEQLKAQGITNPADIAAYRSQFGQPGSPGTAARPNTNPGGSGGGMGTGGSLATLDAATLLADQQRARGAGVMSGETNAPNPEDRTLQNDALWNAWEFQTGPRATDAATGANTAFQNGPRATDAATGANTAFQNGPRATDAATIGNRTFREGPRAQNPVMGELDQFTSQSDEPTKAQLLLDQASQGAMADVLSASRSGRARDAGSQARQAAVAQGEIAGMGVDNARNAALLRQQEAQDFRNQQLQALTQKGGLATSLDANTLQSLGLDSTLAGQRDANTLGALGNISTLAGQRDVNTLGALEANAGLAQARDANTLGALEANSGLAQARDVNTLGAINTGAEQANNIAAQGTAQRAQTLDYGARQDASANALTGDVVKTIPQLEQIKKDREYDLTPEEKMKLGLIQGAAGVLGNIDW